MTALYLYVRHREAVEYDLRERFHFGLERIDRGELAPFVIMSILNGLFEDHSTHTYASVMEWAYVPTPAEVAFYDELDVKIAMNRGKNQPAAPRTKRPWEQAQVSARRDPEHDARLERLKARIGIT